MEKYMSTELYPQNFEQPELEEPGFFDRLRDNAGMAYMKLGRMAASGLLVMGGTAAAFIAEGAINPSVAHADTTTKISFENDYPYAGAKVLNLANFDWWIDENHNGSYNSGETYSPLGYGYRNCTDGAAYWVNKYLGVNVSGWGDAKSWDSNASGYDVKAGNANNIEPGDVAQSDDGNWGHVGFVTDVIKNDAGAVIKLKVAEYNHNSDGAFTHEAYSSKNSDGKFIRSSGRDWDHFIDVNGASGATSPPAETPPSPDTDGDGVVDPNDSCPTKPGLSQNNGCPVTHVYSGTTNGKIYETYWGFGNNLTTWQAASVGSPVTAVTNQIGSNGIQHIYFGTQGGEVYETYWGGGNSLTTSQLVDLNTPIKSMSSQVASDGTQHVYTGAQDGRINETYWGPNDALTTWQVANVGSSVDALSTDITSGPTQHIYSGTADGKVRESYWGPNETLTTYQLANIGNAIVALDSGITGDGTNHVMTSTVDGKSFETYWGGGNSLTTAQMANLGATITSMASRFRNGTWHIYNGTSVGTVKETYWGGGFNLATGELLNAGSPVASVTAEITTDDVQHVFTATQDGKIRETYWGGGNSLTTSQIADLGAGAGITDIFSRVK